jgi:hypothetical protein
LTTCNILGTTDSAASPFTSIMEEPTDSELIWWKSVPSCRSIS